MTRLTVQVPFEEAPGLASGVFWLSCSGSAVSSFDYVLEMAVLVRDRRLSGLGSGARLLIFHPCSAKYPYLVGTDLLRTYLPMMQDASFLRDGWARHFSLLRCEAGRARVRRMTGEGEDHLGTSCRLLYAQLRAGRGCSQAGSAMGWIDVPRPAKSRYHTHTHKGRPSAGSGSWHPSFKCLLACLVRQRFPLRSRLFDSSIPSYCWLVQQLVFVFWPALLPPTRSQPHTSQSGSLLSPSQGTVT